LNVVLPLLSSIVAFVFAVTVLDQFFARRKPYQLTWAIGLFRFLTQSRGIWILSLPPYSQIMKVNYLTIKEGRGFE